MADLLRKRFEEESRTAIEVYRREMVRVRI